MTAFEALSARPGEIWQADIATQIRDEVDTLGVRALTAAGSPVTLQIHFTQVWAGVSGWRRALACPLCGRAVHVLAVTDTGAGCARCIPRRTKQQLKKNSKAWVVERDLARLIRRTLRGTDTARDFIETAHALRRRELQQVQCVLDAAQLAVGAADASMMPAARLEAVAGGELIEAEENDEVEPAVEAPCGSAPSEESKRRRAAVIPK
jgi:hypothetical protein